MTDHARPIVISAPSPRSLDLIFTPKARATLGEKYDVVECEAEDMAGLPNETLAQAQYIIGQPPISAVNLDKMTSLKAVLNVESNLINNMPYETLFQQGIYVLTTGQVFATPVAEMGLAMALNLARGIVDADVAFREGRELWGGDGNAHARLLTGADVGIIGFGDLGRALKRVLSGFGTRIRVYDPWLPPSILREEGVETATLEMLLQGSDFIFTVASVTSENQGFLGVKEFAMMRKRAAFVLLSRAEVVDFDALIDAVARGHIMAASDVFPDEPPAPDHPVRSLPGFLRSAHRAGALDVAFKNMGDMVLEDMDLMDRGLPPLRCKRAERETVARMRSKPVDIN